MELQLNYQSICRIIRKSTNGNSIVLMISDKCRHAILCLSLGMCFSHGFETESKTMTNVTFSGDYIFAAEQFLIA